ncbi:MAG: thioesterase family protein [Sulfuricaulis sp.]|nr:thioesterase family protein [Sulfuricaulis sp.]
MNEARLTCQPWDGSDLTQILTLDEAGPGHYRNRHGDPNPNGRAYGGQVMGQALMAASRTVDPQRDATTLQLLFLQGTQPDEAVDFEVTTLQDGKRFSSRHIRGRQAGGRIVIDAHATFSIPVAAPEHTTASTAVPCVPQNLPDLSGIPQAWAEGIRRLGGYTLMKSGIDFRIPDAMAQLAPQTAQSRISFWLKTRNRLSDDRALHAAAFAYLSDWWVNFSSLSAHVRDLEPDRRLYIASLNHSVWLHRAFRADEWMYCDCHSPRSAGGRGLSQASIYDQSGQLVASVTQECLMAYA